MQLREAVVQREELEMDGDTGRLGVVCHDAGSRQWAQDDVQCKEEGAPSGRGGAYERRDACGSWERCANAEGELNREGENRAV